MTSEETTGGQAGPTGLKIQGPGDDQKDMTSAKVLIVLAGFALAGCTTTPVTVTAPTTTSTAYRPAECFMSLDELQSLQAEAGSYGADTLMRELERQAYIRGHLCD
jgi:hypothetical protein